MVDVRARTNAHTTARPTTRSATALHSRGTMGLARSLLARWKTYRVCARATRVGAPAGPVGALAFVPVQTAGTGCLCVMPRLVHPIASVCFPPNRCAVTSSSVARDRSVRQATGRGPAYRCMPDVDCVHDTARTVPFLYTVLALYDLEKKTHGYPSILCFVRRARLHDTSRMARICKVDHTMTCDVVRMRLSPGKEPLGAHDKASFDREEAPLMHKFKPHQQTASAKGAVRTCTLAPRPPLASVL